MVTRVLDTNIIVKWFLLEEDSQATEGFLEELVAGQALVLIPSSLFYEVANVLWVRRRNGLTESACLTIWQQLKRLPLTVIEWHELLPEALSLSYQHEIAVYDAVFVRLAQLYGCEFITADQKLLQKVAGTYEWIKGLEASGLRPPPPTSGGFADADDSGREIGAVNLERIMKWIGGSGRSAGPLLKTMLNFTS